MCRVGPYVVLADIRLGRKSGLDLARQLADVNPGGRPIIRVLTNAGGRISV
jgi:DNA-binding NarL/FixJ family response regulator